MAEPKRVLARVATRDNILFLVGILGIIYETIAEKGDRPTLLILFGAMVGLPVFLRTDEKQRSTTAEAQAKAQQAEEKTT